MKVFPGVLFALAGAVCLTSSGLALAQIDQTASTISATAKQLGVPISGKFKKFDADIKFDPAALAGAAARFTVDVNSYDMGMPDYNKEVTGKSWFDAAAYPTASFVSSAIQAAGGDSYRVTGKLTLKGKTQDISFPVTVKTSGTTRTFDGAFPIKRNDFAIGNGEWKDTSVVADEVVVKFHIVGAAR